MGWEHPPETVWRCQEMYCSDRMSFDAVAQATGVAASTLKRWSEIYDWRKKREDLAKAQADIRANFVLARSSMLVRLLESGDAMTAFGVAKLEDLALRMAQAAKAGEALAQGEPEALRRIESPADILEALEEAVQIKVAMMLSDPAQLRDVNKVRDALKLVGEMKRAKGQGGANTMSLEFAETMRRDVLGIVK